MPRLVRPRAKIQLQPIGTFQLDEYIHSVMFSPDGSRLAVADASGQVAVWHVGSQECVFRNTNHQGAVLAEGWHLGGKILATAGEDGVGRVWDVGSGEERAVVPVGDGKGWVEHLAWESGGERLAMTAGKTLQILKWSESGGCSVEWETSDHKSSVSDLCWRKGYPGQIFSSCFGGATLWQVGMDSPVNTFPYDGALLSFSISSNGQYLAAGNLDGSVHLWSLSTGQNWHMAGYPCKVGHVVLRSLWRIFMDSSRSGFGGVVGPKIRRIQWPAFELPSGVDSSNCLSPSSAGGGYGGRRRVALLVGAREGEAQGESGTACVGRIVLCGLESDRCLSGGGRR